MKKWIEFYTNEWDEIEKQWNRGTEPESSQKIQQTKEPFHFLIQLWKLLQTLSEHESSITVLPGFKIADFSCDAAMITAGGVYLYHLLPCEAKAVTWQGQLLIASKGEESWAFQIGNVRKAMSGLEQRLGIANTPIYELYITPASIPGCYVFGSTMVINLAELAVYFENLVFRKSEPATQLIDFIEQHRWLNEQCLPKQRLEVTAQEDKISPSLQDVRQASTEVTAGTEQVALTIAAEAQAEPMTRRKETPVPAELPPRRREAKQKEISWWKKLLGNKKKN